MYMRACVCVSVPFHCFLYVWSTELHYSTVIHNEPKVKALEVTYGLMKTLWSALQVFAVSPTKLRAPEPAVSISPRPS